MQKIIICISLLAAVVCFVDAQFASFTYSCPTLFTLTSSSIASYCHSFSTTVKTWDAAQTDCIVQGGYLAKINDMDEDTVILNIISEDFWFGAKNKYNNDTFYFTDDTILDNGLGTWEAGQPSNGVNEDCVRIDQFGVWNDYDCSTTFKYICEVDVIKTLTCASGWELNPNDTEGINACYKFVSTPVNFVVAAIDCMNNESTLFRATTQAEHDFVYTTMGTDMWLDASDMIVLSTEGTFVTVTFMNTTALFPIPWNSNEPNNKDGCEDCTIIFGSGCAAGKVNDVSCKGTYNYVCKTYELP